MSLYRQDSTGFLCEFGASPGAGYTGVPAQPTDTIDNRVVWWRARDVDPALGQSSVWHPSLTGGYEPSAPQDQAGRGVNVMAGRYSTWNEPGGIPALVVSGVTASLSAGGVGGAVTNRLTLISTAANGICWLTPLSSLYNIRLTQNLSWIVSLFAAPNTAAAVPFNILIKTSASGAIYTIPGVTGAVSGVFTRVFGDLNLTSDTSVGAQLGIQIPSAGVILHIDQVMLEERVGSVIEPSAFNDPAVIVGDGQISEVSATKLRAGTVGAVEIIMEGSGSVMRSSDYVPGVSGWRIAGDGAAEFFEVLIRGALNAGDLVLGAIPTGRYGTATIPSAAIVNLVVDKLVGGQIAGQTITLSGSSASIRSNNYVSGSSGFMIRGDGVAEFQSVTIRGALHANDLVSGTINGSRFGGDTIGSGPIISGSLHSQLTSFSIVSGLAYKNSTTLDVAVCSITPVLSFPYNVYRTAILIFISVSPLGGIDAPGWLTCGVMRGFRSSLIGNRPAYASNGCVQVHMLTGIDSSQAYLAQTIYGGAQQNWNPSGSIQQVRIDITALEFLR